ncbi:MAG: class IV adenylate cyclase [Nanoarchaeota archaeon]
MIEVESKAKIPNPKKFRILAQTIGRYKGKERKIDDYYTMESLNGYPKKSLRIRKKGSIFIVNFKQRIFYDRGVYAKKETEFEVSDINGFIRLIHDFGFKKWLTKEKYTELYEIKNNFHIELNHVKNLGWYIEVEYLCNSKDIRKAKKEVLNVLAKLHLHKRDIVKEGYTKLLWDKKR